MIKVDFISKNKFRKNNYELTICKRVKFACSSNAFIKVGNILVLLFTPLIILAQNPYITTANLNLRNGAGKNFKSIVVLSKGDTVTLLDNSEDYWAKIQYKDKIGYSAKQYLQKIEIIEEAETKRGNGFIVFLVFLLIIIVTSIILKKTGEKYRYKSIATILSFFFGAFGFQKFYLGEKNKGVYSILFCWTFIPSLIGLIDFFKYAFMKEQVFISQFNYNKKPAQKKKSKKTPYKKKPKKNQSTIDSQSYIVSLYQKGLYLNEILDAARDVKLKMPNGDDILNNQQVTSIIRSKIPNANFEVKSKITPKAKHTPPKSDVVNTKAQNKKPTQPVKKDLDALNFAKKSYPNDLEMQDYIYKEQVESKKFMQSVKDIELIKFSKEKYPDDYSMQEYIHNEQLALPKNERVKIDVDETIIDINSENLDLSVEQNSDESTSHQQPPYWGHTYVYSYDEIKHATKAQKQFYAYFKNQVANGKYVDIQGNTNYAFILYFDFLREYENHRDIKLLDEQFKLLGEICPKTRSYSLRSLQDELRKRNDGYSVDKLKDLEEPTYQFEHGYSDYNPDLYKLGNKYKDKLGLNKQEIRWLNKFYNPTNVFLSIEGCCITTIMQYVTLLKELEKQLKKKETTLAKEVTYFKEKLKAIYVKRNSDWGYSDSGYIGNQAESEVYLTMFKRIENSVRESFGHKRKVSGDFPYTDNNLSEEFETKLGNSLNGLIEELKDNVGQPNLETQIELNTQNVNRWRIELDELIVAFEKEKIGNFIDGVIHLEETNQKNPNIENIFYQASKFISKYDRVQSLKYYAKYIYYDLKSKKFDNKELTKTVQKSLFKTKEQINDFKEIIAGLIETKDIQTALDKISKIYISKRKRIQLDLSEIKEVEQKHEGTVELLNEYLEDRKEKTEEDVEIAIIPSRDNNSVFISEISIGQVQEELVKMIINNSYEIHQDEVDKYAAANGMFKNQLIDSINEACEEHLDGEALIEEDDENYIIEESYYKEITK